MWTTVSSLRHLQFFEQVPLRVVVSLFPLFCLPELLLCRVSVHGTYLEEAIWGGGKKLFKHTEAHGCQSTASQPGSYCGLWLLSVCLPVIEAT